MLFFCACGLIKGQVHFDSKSLEISCSTTSRIDIYKISFYSHLPPFCLYTNCMFAGVSILIFLVILIAMSLKKECVCAHICWSTEQ